MKLLPLLLLCTTGVLCRRRDPKQAADDDDDNVLLGMSDEARLYNTLTSNYRRWNPHRALRPVFSTAETMHVGFGLAALRFGYDEATQTALLHTWERYQWNDVTLKWAAEDFGGISQIRIPISQIWKPDIMLYNSNEPSVGLDKETLAVVSSDGTVLYIPRVNHKAYCSSDHADDTLLCNFKFGSWTYDGFKLNVDFFEGLEEVDLSDYITSNSYELVKHPATKNVKYYPCCDEPYPDLTFSLEFKKLGTWWSGKK